MHFVKFSWRKQKNVANGESKIFARVKEEPNICQVLAITRIIERANCFGVPAHKPVAIFQTRQKKRAFIADSWTTNHLKLTALAVLNINSNPTMVRGPRPEENNKT